MTYIGVIYTNQKLFEELRSQAIREQVRDIYAYKELVEELIEEKRQDGFFDDNDDLPQIVKNLMLRWPEVEEVLVNNGVL